MEKNKLEISNEIIGGFHPSNQKLKNDNKNSYYSSNSSIQNSISTINFNICKSVKKIVVIEFIKKKNYQKKIIQQNLSQKFKIFL